MMTVEDEINNITQANTMIARVRTIWLARATNLGLPKKGRTRDQACLNFLCGALAILDEGTVAYNKMSVWVFLVSVRGSGEFENVPEPAKIAA